MTGYLFMVNGCLIDWKATLQQVVALSTTKAKHTTTTDAVKEALWLKGLLGELGMNQEIVTV